MKGKVFYYTDIEIYRTQPGANGEERRFPAPLIRGDAIVFSKKTGTLSYVVSTARDVAWNFSVKLRSIISHVDRDGRESYAPGSLLLQFTTPDNVARLRSYLVLAVSGHVAGLREDEREDEVIWILE